MCLEGGFKRREEALKLLKGQAGAIQKLAGVRRDTGIADTSHPGTSWVKRGTG
jgi:hypothetical protein